MIYNSVSILKILKRKLQTEFFFLGTADIILAMYDMCRFDKAWALSHRSPWCAAFIKNELLLLEYIDDLENYYDSGFGHYLNLKLGCVPLKDMIEKFT